jgi:flavin reductase
MRRLAATVNVVTIRASDRAMGMTATAVLSLSSDPPSLLVYQRRFSVPQQRLGWLN